MSVCLKLNLFDLNEISGWPISQKTNNIVLWLVGACLSNLPSVHLSCELCRLLICLCACLSDLPCLVCCTILSLLFVLVCKFVIPPVHLSVLLTICSTVFVLVCLSVCLSLCLSMFLCLSISLYLCPLCLSVSHSLSFCLFSICLTNICVIVFHHGCNQNILA